MNSFLESYIPTLILMTLGLLIVGLALFVSKLIRPSKPSEIKSMAYECGELPEGVAWSAFNIRFYVIGLVFIIFDVESVLMFPVAAVFRRFVDAGLGQIAFFEMCAFVLVLVTGLIYCWAMGDLDWVKSFRQDKHKIDKL